MHIAILGTKSSGGINSVIEGYIQDGLYNDCTFTRIPTHSGSGKLLDLFLFIRGFIILFFTLVTKADVIVHAHMSMNGSFWRKAIYLWLSKLFGAKFIIHLHGSEFKVFFSRSNSRVKKIIAAVFEKADAVIVLSESWADFISSIAVKSNVVVVNNYVDVQRATVTRKSGNILFLGAFISRKGIYDLLVAFSKINTQALYQLHLCGGGENELVTEKVKQLGLEKSVINHGWIGAAQKSMLLAECSTLILPSYNEGLPMVVIEAMGSDIPLITTPVGGIPDVVEHEVSGLLVTPGNVDEIAAALTRVLTEPELAQELVQNASALYEQRFTSKVAFPKIKEIYFAII
nr:glycosyltransferase family 4 protein [uncultured Deefgea sp.]